MYDELNKMPFNDQAGINNLMRLVQGTVAPQVNAGAAEVARVHLSLVYASGALSQESNSFLHKNREKLKVFFCGRSV